MLKETWRRLRAPAVWAVALVLSAPALVQAQTQLFPLAPIRRERVPCPMEDPVYGLYRHQYFGYFPTCWRVFPPGWGCPSPEAPNPTREFQERKRITPADLPQLDEGLGGMEPPLPGEEPEMPRGGNPLPPIPDSERSPFDIDTAPNPNAPDNRMRSPDVPGGGVAPRDERAIPPFVPPTSSRGGPPRATAGEKDPGNEATAPLLALPAPVEAPTTLTPAGPPPGPVSELPGQPGARPGAVSAPIASTASLPPMAHPAGSPPVMMGPSAPPPPPPPPAMAPPGPPPPGIPVQAPQRRGPLGTLFDGLSSRLRR